MFQATPVPDALVALTMVLLWNMAILAHEQTANPLHRVLFSGNFASFGV
jgi:hypothetical protein